MTPCSGYTSLAPAFVSEPQETSKQIAGAQAGLMAQASFAKPPRLTPQHRAERQTTRVCVNSASSKHCGRSEVFPNVALEGPDL